MSSYFAEHDCEPLAAGQAPDHFLHFARLIATGGYHEVLGLEYSDLFNGRPPPPASKTVVAQLKTTNVPDDIAEGEAGKCAVCLKDYTKGETQKHLPCTHYFHDSCVLPWLGKTNTCPMCRFEMKTDDQDYEEYKDRQRREKERKAQIETLHDSMFS